MIKKSHFLPKKNLIYEILQSLRELNGWGSLEIFVQNGKVTQITKREIKKTNHSLEIES